MAETDGNTMDGGMPAVDCAHLNAFHDVIGTGMHVYTNTGDDVGKIKRFDPFSGGMLVEKGMFSHHDLYIPITVVQRVDAGAVYLAVSTEHVQRIDGSEPAAVLFVEVEPAPVQGTPAQP